MYLSVFSNDGEAVRRIVRVHWYVHSPRLQRGKDGNQQLCMERGQLSRIAAQTIKAALHSGHMTRGQVAHAFCRSPEAMVPHVVKSAPCWDAC